MTVLGIVSLFGGPSVLAAPKHVLSIPANMAWTDTGVDVEQGAPLHIKASGSARMTRARVSDWLTGIPVARRVEPQGTYLWPHELIVRDPHAGSRFPLPAIAAGPFPAFCLIGKIGAHGAPFYVGTRYDGAGSAKGRLWLGVNDDTLEDNRGVFHAIIELAASPPAEPLTLPSVDPAQQRGTPLPQARVILFYVDGLRPDVLREMVQGGFLPNFKEVFFDHGLVIRNAFTVFPSNTLDANGALFTGRFSDRTGIKSQNQFERSTLQAREELSEWLPDTLKRRRPTRVLNLLDKYAPENTHTFLTKRGVPTMMTYLGKGYKFTTLPIAPLNPPPLWFHLAVNTIGPFGMERRLPVNLDRVNTQYAIRELIGDPDARVIAIWLPMVDKTSHGSGHGQFGAARRDIALADRYLGEIMARLRQVGWERSTYLILVSDHGHVGGEHTITRRFNLAEEWGYRQLGCNAKVVDHEWLYPGIDRDRFLFFDNQGAGQAKLFLPYRSYFDGPWQRNRLVDLTHYQIRPGVTVNMIESLAQARPAGWDGTGPRPIDLMLVKLDASRVLLYRTDENEAILHRERHADGIERFRYEPVQHATQDEDNTVHTEPAVPGRDPLGYLGDASFLASVHDAAWLATTHTAAEWLQATYQTQYPDAVVTMSKFFEWQSPVEDLAAVRDPDLLMTAAEGWSFRSDGQEGTDHGYPLADSMRMTLALSGPRIVHGTLDVPQRIVNILPTILEMSGTHYDPAQIDGEAITGIYE